MEVDGGRPNKGVKAVRFTADNAPIVHWKDDDSDVVFERLGGACRDVERRTGGICALRAWFCVEVGGDGMNDEMMRDWKRLGGW